MIDPRERQLVTHVVESLRSHRLSEGATKEIKYVLNSVGQRAMNDPDINADSRAEEKKRARIGEYERFCMEAEKFFGAEGYYPTTQLMCMRAERIDPFTTSEFPDIAWRAKMLMEIYLRTWAPWPIRLWKWLFGGDIYKWAVRAGNDLRRH